METERQNLTSLDSSNSSNYSDPMVIGLGAFFLGFVLGSGRWAWFGREAGKIATSLGSLAMDYVTDSLHQHNPQLFTKDSRMTH